MESQLAIAAFLMRYYAFASASVLQLGKRILLYFIY